MKKALIVAELQSKATHAGDMASDCCKFMTYFIVKCINRTEDIDVKNFIDLNIDEFLKIHKSNLCEELICMLQCKIPTKKETCWNWKNNDMKQSIVQTLKNRKNEYNGYPVSSEYFGSFSIDGLAMALWGLYYSKDVKTAILSVVSLYGDADTTGAIVGQMAGAFYGYDNIVDDESIVHCFINMHNWDPFYEIELRTLMLLDKD
jgi:ADP-ribosylglycohydrolase